jgi:hypothetical protein
MALVIETDGSVFQMINYIVGMVATAVVTACLFVLFRRD